MSGFFDRNDRPIATGDHMVVVKGKHKGVAGTVIAFKQVSVHLRRADTHDVIMVMGNRMVHADAYVPPGQQGPATPPRAVHLPPPPRRVPDQPRPADAAAPDTVGYTLVGRPPTSTVTLSATVAAQGNVPGYTAVLVPPPAAIARARVFVVDEPAAQGVLRGTLASGNRLFRASAVVALNDGRVRVVDVGQVRVWAMEESVFVRVAPEQGQVYVMHDPERVKPHSKLGRSDSPLGARDAMRRGNPYVELHATLNVRDATRTEEVALAECPSRVNPANEWFRVAPEHALMVLQRAADLVDAALELKSLY